MWYLKLILDFWDGLGPVCRINYLFLILVFENVAWFSWLSRCCCSTLVWLVFWINVVSKIDAGFLRWIGTSLLNGLFVFDSGIWICRWLNYTEILVFQWSLVWCFKIPISIIWIRFNVTISPKPSRAKNSGKNLLHLFS